MYYPTNTPGSLINSFIVSQKDALAAPEKTQIAEHMSRALCCEVPRSLASTAGWMITPDAQKAQKSLLPYLHTVARALLCGKRTPVWVEYDMNAAMRGYGHVEDTALNMKVGALIMPERNEGGHESLGIITILQHSEERQYVRDYSEASGIDFGANGLSICPVVAHISLDGLEALENDIASPSLLDSLRGLPYNARAVSAIYKKIGGLPSILSKTITTSIFEGVVIDALTLNQWGESERDRYIEDSLNLSVRYAISSFLVFCLTQVSGKKVIPGLVKRQDNVMTWVPSGRPKTLPVLVLTPDILGQVVADPSLVISKDTPKVEMTEEKSGGKKKTKKSPIILPENFNKRWK